MDNGVAGAPENAGLRVLVESLTWGVLDLQLRQKLQVTMPMEFNTPSTLVTGGLHLHATSQPTVPPPPRLSVTLVATSPAACRITGSLTIDTSRGTVVFDIDWPVTNI